MASAYSYRRAEHTDLGACVALMELLIDEIGPKEGGDLLKQAIPRDFQLALESEDCAVFLALQGSEVVGLSRGDVLMDDPTFRLRPDPRCGYVDQMFVCEGHRAAGLGQALLSLVEQWLMGLGVRHVLLHAAPRAMRLYARAGYLPNREMVKQLPTQAGGNEIVRASSQGPPR